MSKKAEQEQKVIRLFGCVALAASYFLQLIGDTPVTAFFAAVAAASTEPKIISQKLAKSSPNSRELVPLVSLKKYKNTSLKS